MFVSIVLYIGCLSVKCASSVAPLEVAWYQLSPFDGCLVLRKPDLVDMFPRRSSALRCSASRFFHEMVFRIQHGVSLGCPGSRICRTFLCPWMPSMFQPFVKRETSDEDVAFCPGTRAAIYLLPEGARCLFWAAVCLRQNGRTRN